MVAASGIYLVGFSPKPFFLWGLVSCLLAGAYRLLGMRPVYIFRAKRVSNYYRYIPKKKSALCACVRLILVLVGSVKCHCYRYVCTTFVPGISLGINTTMKTFIVFNISLL